MFLNAVRLTTCVIKRLIDVFSVFDSIPDWYKTQDMYDRVDSEDPII